MEVLHHLVSARATYRYFDAWQQQFVGHKKPHRRPGAYKEPAEIQQNVRYDAAPSHRDSRTLITSTWASGEPGPLVILYGQKSAASKHVAALLKLYNPEVFGRESHMNDAELLLWYLDVPFRESLTRQRQKLRDKGQRADADRWATCADRPCIMPLRVAEWRKVEA